MSVSTSGYNLRTYLHRCHIFCRPDLVLNECNSMAPMSFSGKSIMSKEISVPVGPTSPHFSLLHGLYRSNRMKTKSSGKLDCRLAYLLQWQYQEEQQFGQRLQEKYYECCGDPPASLQKPITTRGQEKLLGSGLQMSRCKVGISIFFLKRTTLITVKACFTTRRNACYILCVYGVCVHLGISEIPNWFKSTVFGKATCFTPLRIGSTAVDGFKLLLLFSQIILVNVLQLELSIF